MLASVVLVVTACTNGHQANESSHGKSSTLGLSSTSGSAAKGQLNFQESTRPHTARRCGASYFSAIELDGFCGKANATVTVGSKTISFTGGTCILSSSSFELFIGTQIIVINSLDPTASAEETSARNSNPYFGLLVDHQGLPGSFSSADPVSSDGTYREGVISIYQNKLAINISNALVTLQNKRTAGSFSGTSTSSNGATTVSGTFSC
jgi:hypothetical protein